MLLTRDVCLSLGYLGVFTVHLIYRSSVHMCRCNNMVFARLQSLIILCIYNYILFIYMCVCIIFFIICMSE